MGQLPALEISEHAITQLTWGAGLCQLHQRTWRLSVALMVAFEHASKLPMALNASIYVLAVADIAVICFSNNGCHVYEYENKSVEM